MNDDPLIFWFIYIVGSMLLNVTIVVAHKIRTPRKTQSLSYLLFMTGSRHVAPAEASLIAQIDIVLGPFWVWLFFAELPPQSTLLGGSITFIAVTLYLGSEYYLKRKTVSAS